jgi:hypothetical protein
MSQHATGTYVKDGKRRVANTPSEAVALYFDGFKLVGDADLTRSELQGLAKAAGIPANLSNDEIKAKLADAPEGENPKAPETGGDSLVTGSDD